MWSAHVALLLRSTHLFKEFTYTQYVFVCIHTYSKSWGVYTGAGAALSG